jgi:predicted RNA-binding Zn ribbon-like protein
MFGAVAAAVRMGRGVKDLRNAVSELRDVLVSMRALTDSYERAKEDGTITPDEAERLLQQLAATTRQGMEARAVIERLV